MSQLSRISGCRLADLVGRKTGLMPFCLLNAKWESGHIKSWKNNISSFLSAICQWMHWVSNAQCVFNKNMHDGTFLTIENKLSRHQHCHCSACVQAGQCVPLRHSLSLLSVFGNLSCVTFSPAWPVVLGRRTPAASNFHIWCRIGLALCTRDSCSPHAV